MSNQNKNEILIKRLLRDDEKTADSITKTLLEIDKVCYGELSDKDNGPVEYWNKIIPHTFTFAAYSDEKIVGYVDFHKFSDAGIALLEKGKVREGDMLNCIDTSSSKNINIYVGSVAVLPDFRGAGLGIKLLHNGMNFIKQEGYNIKAIYATIWSDAGKAILNNLKTQTIAVDDLGREIIKIVIDVF